MKQVATILICLLTLGCTRTSIQSLIHPELGDRVYTHICVHGNFDNIELKKAIEDKVASETKKRRVECIKFSEVYSFYSSDDSILADLHAKRVQAILVITPGKAGTTEFYIPPTTTSTTTGSITKTTASGGYRGVNPWSTTTAELYDIQTGNKVWRASASTKGNAFANFKNLARSVGGKIVVKLMQDGLIP
ncbi:MAG: hypothetical protein KOO62_10590 [candidate division Zixibacteria bacterium]|nr:hypothetical protein [candidate division Zixibacteria bacterium]